MSAKSKIQWTDATWNPTSGCWPVSPGCANCYAARIASRFVEKWDGTAKGGRWTGRVVCRPDWLDAPLCWQKPRMVFICSMSDLFHEKVPTEFIHEVFQVIEQCPQHTFQVLTKRASRLAGFAADYGNWPNNAWAGVSCENQDFFDERVPHLLRVPAAVRFVSLEPLLGPIDMQLCDELPDGDGCYEDKRHGIGQVIVGGESGPGARPCNIDWIRSIRDQCRMADVPVFVKQLGARPVGSTGKIAASFGVKHPKGGDPAEWPEDLHVRQWPETVP